MTVLIWGIAGILAFFRVQIYYVLDRKQLNGLLRFKLWNLDSFVAVIRMCFYYSCEIASFFSFFVCNDDAEYCLMCKYLCEKVKKMQYAIKLCKQMF